MLNHYDSLKLNNIEKKKSKKIIIIIQYEMKFQK